MTIEIFDTRLLARRRSRAAADLKSHDFLADNIADDLMDRLALIRRQFPTVLDLGINSGQLAQRLATMDGAKTVIAADPAYALLADRNGPRVVIDETGFPFAPASLDLVVSGLAFHLVNDLPGLLIQIQRALKPDGLLLAAMLGGETLKELRSAWLAAEAEVLGGASPRVAPLADLRDLGSLLQRAGFALPVVDQDTLTVTYATPLDLMRELKSMGASNMLAARSRTPVSRRLLLRAAEIYAEQFAQADGRIPATFEILTLTAWAPHESQQKPLKPGSASRRLADALGVSELPAGDKAGK